LYPRISSHKDKLYDKEYIVLFKSISHKDKLYDKEYIVLIKFIFRD